MRFIVIAFALLLLSATPAAADMTVTLNPTPGVAYGAETVAICGLNPNDYLRLYWQYPVVTPGYPADYGAFSGLRVGSKCYSYPINLAGAGTYLLDVWVTDHRSGVETQIADTTFDVI